ncbi:hypothetical protein IG631_24235 [Alternaria alternata]|jgi:hypothetical protein|nr:hypothetical protein IG631_24235 [Alternaria alternata]
MQVTNTACVLPLCLKACAASGRLLTGRGGLRRNRVSGTQPQAFAGLWSADEYEEGSKWDGVGKVDKSGQARHWTMFPKAEDGYCLFPSPLHSLPTPWRCTVATRTGFERA